MTTSEKIVANQLLLAWGRLSMALLLPTIAALGMWLNASFASKAEVSELREKTAILETNQALGRTDRVNFQEQTTTTLGELLRAVNASNERLARLEAQIEAAQKQIDLQR